eukprot:TRINITY_DN9454_c0_g5_i1.p1 TRINITY_DN9454_c0_g5~~TRINITY_DN9454_c0_g5_i1.p1  ORF type:complete len:682 (+),score=89.66 TRINITY_DN9454_c0_g5_i1:76-2121(+)
MVDSAGLRAALSDARSRLELFDRTCFAPTFSTSRPAPPEPEHAVLYAQPALPSAPFDAPKPPEVPPPPLPAYDEERLRQRIFLETAAYVERTVMPAVEAGRREAADTMLELEKQQQQQTLKINALLKRERERAEEHATLQELVQALLNRQAEERHSTLMASMTATLRATQKQQQQQQQRQRQQPEPEPRLPLEPQRCLSPESLGEMQASMEDISGLNCLTPATQELLVAKRSDNSVDKEPRSGTSTPPSDGQRAHRRLSDSVSLRQRAGETGMAPSRLSEQHLGRAVPENGRLDERQGSGVDRPHACIQENGILGEWGAALQERQCPAAALPVHLSPVMVDSAPSSPGGVESPRRRGTVSQLEKQRSSFGVHAGGNLNLGSPVGQLKKELSLGQSDGSSLYNVSQQTMADISCDFVRLPAPAIGMPKVAANLTEPVTNENDAEALDPDKTGVPDEDPFAKDLKGVFESHLEAVRSEHGSPSAPPEIIADPPAGITNVPLTLPTPKMKYISPVADVPHMSVEDSVDFAFEVARRASEPVAKVKPHPTVSVEMTGSNSASLNIVVEQATPKGSSPLLTGGERAAAAPPPEPSSPQAMGSPYRKLPRVESEWESEPSPKYTYPKRVASMSGSGSLASNCLRPVMIDLRRNETMDTMGGDPEYDDDLVSSPSQSLPDSAEDPTGI